MGVVPEGGGGLVDPPVRRPGGAGTDHLVRAAVHDGRKVHAVPVDAGRFVEAVDDVDHDLARRAWPERRAEVVAVEAPGAGGPARPKSRRPGWARRSKTRRPCASIRDSASGGMASRLTKLTLPVVSTTPRVQVQVASPTPIPQSSRTPASTPTSTPTHRREPTPAIPTLPVSMLTTCRVSSYWDRRRGPRGTFRVRSGSAQGPFGDTRAPRRGRPRSVAGAADRHRRVRRRRTGGGRADEEQAGLKQAPAGSGRCGARRARDRAGQRQPTSIRSPRSSKKCSGVHPHRDRHRVAGGDRRIRRQPDRQFGRTTVVAARVAQHALPGAPRLATPATRHRRDRPSGQALHDLAQSAEPPARAAGPLVGGRPPTSSTTIAVAPMSRNASDSWPWCSR